MSSGNPYSSSCPVTPDMFQGYLNHQPGCWKNPSEIASCAARCQGVMPSFWVIGEQRMGKTSYLRKLESLLLRPARRSTGPVLPIPLYVSCEKHSTLHSFYGAPFQQFRKIAEDLPRLSEPKANKLLAACESVLWSGEEPRHERDLLTRAIQALGKLRDGLTEDLGRIRLILLIDDAEQAVQQGWGSALFGHLRHLLIRPPSSTGGGLPPEDLAVVLSGGRALAETDSGLFDVLDDVVLEPLARRDVWTLVSRNPDHPVDRRWQTHVYSATGGHPWLVQDFLSVIVSSGQELTDEASVDALVHRVRRRLESLPIIRGWLESLPVGANALIAKMALDCNGCSFETLAQESPEAAMTRLCLRRMIEMGLVFEPPFARGRFMLTRIFKDWFLEHTGARVLLDEIERLRREGPRTSAPPLRPYTLLITPNLIVGEGFYTTVCRSEAGIDVKRLSVQFADARDDQRMGYLSSDLARSLLQSQWDQGWLDYCKEVQEPIFVVRIDKELLTLPVEVARINGEYLGLSAPVYKQVMGISQQQGYHLVDHCFDPNQETNVLLVASGAGGTFDGMSYGTLPYAVEEPRLIVQALRAPEATIRLGRITVISDRDPSIDGVDWHQLSGMTVERALRGDLDQVTYHLLHYSGHYVPRENDDLGGLLLADGTRLELFNLAQLRGALRHTDLRLAFINGCNSGEHVESAYYPGAAYTALLSGVSAVIGIRWAITDSNAYLVSELFYKALARTGKPELAIFEAREALHVTFPKNRLWAAPAMLTR